MIHLSKIVEQYPGLIQEMRFLANDCLLKQGALSGLQLALSEDNDYIDEHYVREKIRETIKTLEGIEHDLDICIRIGEGKQGFKPQTLNTP